MCYQTIYIRTTLPRNTELKYSKWYNTYVFNIIFPLEFTLNEVSHFKCVTINFELKSHVYQ